MSKIKLLILLLISSFFGACTSNPKPDYQFTINYIGGGADGLIYSNYLNSYLKSLNMYDALSSYSIDTSINHKKTLFVTNVNNTSDRELIITIITAKINDNIHGCTILEFKDDVQQYYVISSNIYFNSNDKAVENIKRSNSEILTKKFVNYLYNLKNLNCRDD